MSVHSKDLLRVPIDSKVIHSFDVYKAQNEADSERRNGKRTIELRFLERIATDTHGYEVGIYKTSSTDPKGETRNYYGKFHVVLRKEGGRWKILVDADSNENHKIGENEFLSAKPL